MPVQRHQRQATTVWHLGISLAAQNGKLVAASGRPGVCGTHTCYAFNAQKHATLLVEHRKERQISCARTDQRLRGAHMLHALASVLTCTPAHKQKRILTIPNAAGRTTHHAYYSHSSMPNRATTCSRPAGASVAHSLVAATPQSCLMAKTAVCARGSPPALSLRASLPADTKHITSHEIRQALTA